MVIEEEPWRRFNMSAPPERADGKYEEKLTNWLLEAAFFRDFVFREQPGKGGKGELADGLVLFDDTALFVQCKAQTGERAGTGWARKNLKKALKQVTYGERMLRERLVPEVVSDTLGPMPFDPDCYPVRFGLIVIDMPDDTPFVASEMEPELADVGFPVHVVSLRDFIELATRMDTAGDLLWYLGLRQDLVLSGVVARVHDEFSFVSQVLVELPDWLVRVRPDIDGEILRKTMGHAHSLLSGELRDSPDRQYGLLVDDVIARMHERDPEQEWNEAGTKADVAAAIVLLSDLTRSRRIEMGKLMHRAARDAEDGSVQYFRWITNDCAYVSCTATNLAASESSLPARFSFLPSSTPTPRGASWWRRTQRRPGAGPTT